MDIEADIAPLAVARYAEKNNAGALFNAALALHEGIAGAGALIEEIAFRHRSRTNVVLYYLGRGEGCRAKRSHQRHHQREDTKTLFHFSMNPFLVFFLFLYAMRSKESLSPIRACHRFVTRRPSCYRIRAYRRPHHRTRTRRASCSSPCGSFLHPVCAAPRQPLSYR